MLLLFIKRIKINESQQIPIDGEEKVQKNEIETGLFQKAINVALKGLPIQKEGRITLGKKKKIFWCKLSMVRKVCPSHIARGTNCDNDQALLDQESQRMV